MNAIINKLNNGYELSDEEAAFVIRALEELESLKANIGELKNYADLFCDDAIVCAKINNL